MSRPLDESLRFIRDRRKSIKDVDSRQAAVIALAIRTHLKDELNVTEEELDLYLSVALTKSNEGLEAIGAAVKAVKTTKKRKINEVTTSSLDPLTQNTTFQKGLKSMKRNRRQYDEEEKKNIRALYYKTKESLGPQSDIGFDEEFVRSFKKARNDYATFSVTTLNRIIHEDGDIYDDDDENEENRNPIILLKNE